MDKYTKNAIDCSKITTKNYSTSFSLGVSTLDGKFRNDIYAIYGFVRFADEIVDTFHQHNKNVLLEQFKKETYDAINRGISLNPILHSFQKAVNEYQIDHELIDAFLKSMHMDLSKKNYDSGLFQKYVFGSAEVVGLMCLRVFYKDDNEAFEQLKPFARKLGEAFQKINFLRDLKDDYIDRGRVYFPKVDFLHFSDEDKQKLEEDIARDFNEALPGIKKLRKEARLGVYLAYIYYTKLFKKIKKTKASELIKKRYRISNFRKLLLLFQCYFRNKFNIIIP
jgi:15-cis-phytoene synthase